MFLRVLITALLVMTGVQSSKADESWVVTLTEAECLIGNLDAYLNTKNEPVVIFVRLCPESDNKVAMRKLQKNSVLPSGPSIVIGPDGTVLDEFIVYSKQELRCLKGMDISKKMSPVRLPQKPCE